MKNIQIELLDNSQVFIGPNSDSATFIRQPKDNIFILPTHEQTLLIGGYIKVRIGKDDTAFLPIKPDTEKILEQALVDFDKLGDTPDMKTRAQIQAAIETGIKARIVGPPKLELY